MREHSSDLPAAKTVTGWQPPAASRDPKHPLSQGCSQSLTEHGKGGTAGPLRIDMGLLKGRSLLWGSPSAGLRPSQSCTGVSALPIQPSFLPLPFHGCQTHITLYSSSLSSSSFTGTHPCNSLLTSASCRTWTGTDGFSNGNLIHPTGFWRILGNYSRVNNDPTSPKMSTS